MALRSLRGIVSAAAGVAALASISWSQVLPPPANQYLGMFDTVPSYQSTEDCTVCHTGSDTIAFRHHALINTTTPPVSCVNYTGNPASLANGCHVLIPDGSGGYTLQDFRTCGVCHVSSPHHSTQAALQLDCKSCHGSFVDNPGDGHYIPSYDLGGSMAPHHHGYDVVDPVTGRTITVNGCAACHQADPTAIDPRTGVVRPVFDNADTHHATQLDCAVCHPGSDPASTTIRSCEACHGPDTLHNIQMDSPTAENFGIIVPFKEQAGWGHVGSNWDCIGCHYSWLEVSWLAASAGPWSATVPYLKEQSAYTLPAGSARNLTLTGSGFVNVGGDGQTYSSVVVLDNGRSPVTIQPAAITDREIRILLPALTAGNYTLRVVKSDKQSNRAALTVVPPLRIGRATLGAAGTITITGSGFGPAPPTGYKAGLGIFAGTTEATVISWSPTRIVATSPAFARGTAVTVKTINGTVSGSVLTTSKHLR
ncbi:IPT/TIG domain-containing protein [Geobacter sulfurreducens]|uniref:IPT/TIG domain-containing protein n=1 Tax=Geobacter sulfurreducens TaxID=35554 RepID=UPI000DBB9831|nr:IPT/TIG domain-containing protein [Geobacter sulfurreducens]BBA69857.1 C-type multiheme cytochrome [Geobacter sulfurreducens]